MTLNLKIIHPSGTISQINGKETVITNKHGLCGCSDGLQDRPYRLFFGVFQASGGTRESRKTDSRSPLA